MGETITFRYDGLKECSQVKINFCKDEKEYYVVDSTYSKEFSTYFESSGVYQIYVSGEYNGKWYNSDPLIVKVFNPQIFDDKNVVAVGENISLRYEGLQECTQVYFHFLKNNTEYYKVDSTKSKTFSTYFEDAGTYQIYASGEISGEWIKTKIITVTVLAPGIYDNKNVATVNENVIFQYSGLSECSQVMFIFEKDGYVYKKVDSTLFSKYSISFELPGTYQVYASGLLDGRWFNTKK